MKRILTIVLCLFLLVSAQFALAEDTLQQGDTMFDFSFTTYQGDTVQLYDVLKKKDMVLINLWASWCGPCESEFPFLEEAYEMYSDRVEVLALSIDAEDSDQILEDYADEHGMTFLIGRDTQDLVNKFAVDGVPTSIVVDRFGTICLIEVGSQSATQSFTDLFDVFCAEDYTESVLLDGIPEQRPTVANAPENELDEAMNVAGGTIRFHNEEDETSWPMLPAEKDGRACLKSTTQGTINTVAALVTTVEVKAGEAFAVDVKLSAEPVYDRFYMMVNGQVAKLLHGEWDWTTIAYVFPEDGNYDICFYYAKDDEDADTGEDTLYLDNARIMTVAEAEEYVASQPIYPVGEKAGLQLLNENAKEITLTDPDGIMQVFGQSVYYIVPDSRVQVSATLAAGMDPEMAIFSSNYVEGISLAKCVSDECYVYETELEAGTYNSISMNTNIAAFEEGESEQYYIFAFADEAAVNSFFQLFDMMGMPLGNWQYADGTQPETPYELAELALDGVANYEFEFVDQNDEPVAGVMLNICDEESCSPMLSDEDGMILFSGVPYAYDLHVLKIPEGYSFDMTQAFTAPEEGGYLCFVITKE